MNTGQNDAWQTLQQTQPSKPSIISNMCAQDMLYLMTHQVLCQLPQAPEGDRSDARKH